MIKCLISQLLSSFVMKKRVFFQGNFAERVVILLYCPKELSSNLKSLFWWNQGSFMLVKYFTIASQGRLLYFIKVREIFFMVLSK